MSIQVPNVKVALVKGKCKGKLLDLIKQEVGQNITIFNRKFKTNQFLNTDWLIDKITTTTTGSDDAGGNGGRDLTNKVKDTIEVLKEVANSDLNNSTLLDSLEFRLAIIKAYKVTRKKGKIDKKHKRKFDAFFDDEEQEKDNEKEDDHVKNPKKRKRKHFVPVADDFSDDSDNSGDLAELEASLATKQSKEQALTHQPDPHKDPDANMNISPPPSPSRDPNPDPNTKNSATTAEDKQQENNISDVTQPHASTSTSPSPSESKASSSPSPRKGQIQKCYVCRQRFYTASKVNKDFYVRL